MIAFSAGGCMRRDLQRVEAAPGDAHHADLAAAPGLRRDPGDDVDRRPAPARNIRRPSGPSESPVPRMSTRIEHSRGRRNRDGSAGRASWCRRACDRADTRGWPAPGSRSASSGSHMRADSRQPSGMTMPMSGNSTILRGNSVTVFMRASCFLRNEAWRAGGIQCRPCHNA